MNATLSSHGLRQFARDLRFLARVGNDVYIETHPESLVLRVMNNSKTCFCSFTFEEGFFLSFRPGGDDFNENNCRVSIRPLLQVLKSVKTSVNCQLRIDAERERLIVEVMKPRNIQITNTITILEYSQLDEIPLPNTPLSTIVCKPSILSGLLSNMPKNIREIAINFTKEQMKIENHINHPEIDVQTVRLKYELDPTEFTSYVVIADTRLILSSHDFQSIVEFAETSKEELKITFIKNGKPLICEIGDENSGKVRMVMTTMREEALKATRKPPEATSYKELMGSYISVRQNSETPEKSRPISNSEIHRAMSPGVESFQPSSSKMSYELIRSSQSSVHKRKSTEMTDVNSGNLISSESQNDEHPKKMRQSGDLTQEDEEAIYRMVEEDLEEQMEESMAADIQVEQNKDDTSQSQEPGTSDFMKGFINLKVKTKLGSTVDASESSEYNGDSEYNERFDVSKANFPTPCEEIPQVSIRQVNPQRKELTSEQAKLIKANQLKKMLFNACFGPSKRAPINKGTTLCEKSDTSDESDDGE